jgi:DNA-binding NtrC family response regulator
LYNCEAAHPVSQTAGRVILLVEDHFDTRWATALYLRGHGGFRVIEALNAAEAKTVLKTATNIDLVFTDINMPGAEDGYEVAQWVATHHPKLPVVLTSGDREDARAYTKSGLREFVRKPYDLDRVIQICERMTGGA